LKDGLELSFIDKSLFFEMISLAQPTSVPPISKLGLDALFEPVTVDEFTKSLSKKKIFIKALLLCVIARNISPIDVITHVPIRCEEAGILYVCVPLKE
ncbi:Ribosomal protein eL8/eL30/eS12/Gadd45 - like 6, partial [Theobroma cacao]